MKMVLGMCWDWEWDARMKFGTLGAWESVSHGALEIGKGWVWCRNHLLNPDLDYTYTSLPSKPLKMTEKVICLL